MNTRKAIAFGQAEYNHRRARINWLLVTEKADQGALARLIDNLAMEAGLRGSEFMLASTSSDNDLFKILRRAGYCVYGWERFWKIDFSKLNNQTNANIHWTEPLPIDQYEIVKFQQKYLSHAARSVTPLANEISPDFVWKDEGDIKGCVSIKSFGNRSVIHAIFSSDMADPEGAINNLLALQLGPVSTWYFAQTNNLVWLENTLVKIATPVTDRRELLVKYFAIMEKSAIGLLNHASERGHPDPVAPFIHTSKSQDNL